MKKIRLFLNTILLPITLIAVFIEWFHFNISEKLVSIFREYRKWLIH